MDLTFPVDSSTKVNDDFMIPFLAGYPTASREETSLVFGDMFELLDGYREIEATNTTIDTIFDAHKNDSIFAKTKHQSQKEIESFNTINEFAKKLLNNQLQEPREAQKVTYSKFWDLF